MKMAHFQLEPGQAEESNTEAQTKAHKLQHLFAQLKPLIAGQGKVTVCISPLDPARHHSHKHNLCDT